MSADIAEEFGEDVAARCWTPGMLQSCASHSLHIKEDIEIPFLLGEDSTVTKDMPEASTTCKHTSTTGSLLP
jgi:hypothetical protein